MTRVAVFGGSFNPPHVSHVLAAAYVLATQPVDSVLVVPTFSHPFGKALVSFEHRHAMCVAAFADLRRVEVSDIERTLGGESKSLITLRALADRNPTWALRFVIGSDILGETHKWFGWNEIVRIAPPIVLGRVGYAVPGVAAPVLPEAASRELRTAIARGDDVAPLVPQSVLAYAREHRLYEEGT